MDRAKPHTDPARHPPTAKQFISQGAGGLILNMSALDKSIPLGRVAQSSEIADVAVFLASGKAGYMTATTVVIDGGIMPGSVGL